MDFVVIGRVVDTFRTEGKLKVEPFAPDELFERIKKVFFKRRGGDYIPFKVIEVKPHGRFWIIALEGINTLEEAQQFKGAKVFAREDDLPDLAEDEFYAFELEGMKVVTDKGNVIGKVERVQDMGPYWALVCGDLLIPFVEDIVISVSRKDKTVKVKEDLLPL